MPKIEHIINIASDFASMSKLQQKKPLEIKERTSWLLINMNAHKNGKKYSPKQSNRMLYDPWSNAANKQHFYPILL